MSAESEDLAARALARRKRRDQAFILPVAGLFLMISPLIGLFANAGMLWGVPIILYYICIVWLGLIYAAYRLSSHSSDDMGSDTGSTE